MTFANTSRLYYKVHDYLLIVLGCCIYAFAWTGFILSQGITTGGLAGISTLIKIATGIPAAIPYNIINVGLAVVALIFLGWRFMVKTVISVAVLAIIIPFGEQYLVMTEVVNGVKTFTPILLPNEPALALVIGSILSGLGIAIVFSVNSSTGGTDIIVAILNKYKNMSLGRAILIIDNLIILCSYLVNVYIAGKTQSDAFNLLIYSAIEVILVSVSLDWYLNSNRQSVQFLIFSLKYEEIKNAVQERAKRGCTLLDATGGYSGQPCKVLMVVVRKTQSLAVHRIIREIDPKAFVSESVVRGVYGEGFQAIKQ